MQDSWVRFRRALLAMHIKALSLMLFLVPAVVVHAQTSSKDYIYLGGRVIAIENPVQNNAVPTVATLSPAGAVAGDSNFTLTVNGTGFVSGSLVNWNGATTGLTTAYQSTTLLTATVSASLVATAGTATITVVNPAPGGGTSAGQTFTITPLAITSLSPPSATATGGVGSPLTLTVKGTGFEPGSTVDWNGSAVTTAYGSTVVLTATVPTTDISSPGTATVTVTNPSGVTSANSTFTIAASGTPSISQISPPSILANSAAFTLTVTGTNFNGSSSVNWTWNGTTTGLTTTWNATQPTQLTAAVPASLITGAGTATITVSNSLTGGGTSSGVSFLVTNSVPVLTSISPQTLKAGNQAFTLTVNGSNFVNGADGSVVQWNNSNRATTFVSSTQLTASILAADLATAGTATVTVVNPPPSGGTSSPASFTITPSAPVITTSASLPAATAGQYYTYTIQAVGGTSPYQWTMSNNPPAGIYLYPSSTSATIAGIVPISDYPTNASFSFTLSVTDSEAQPQTSAPVMFTLPLVVPVTNWDVSAGSNLNTWPGAAPINVSAFIPGATTTYLDPSWSLSGQPLDSYGIGSIAPATSGAPYSTNYTPPVAVMPNQFVYVVGTNSAYTPPTNSAMLIVEPPLPTVSVSGNSLNSGPVTISSGQQASFVVNAALGDNWASSNDYLSLYVYTGQGNPLCNIDYYPSTNTVTLQNETSTGPLTGTLASSGAPLSTTSCSLSLSGPSAVQSSGYQLSATFPITFTSELAGQSVTAYVAIVGFEGSTDESYSNPIGTLVVANGGASPSISSLSPTSGSWGQAVTISGANFGTNQWGTSTVTFNGVAASTASWTSNSIVATVPFGVSTGPVVVTVGGTASNSVQFTVSGTSPNLTSQVLTTSGTWTVPAGVTAIQAQCWGPGGNGGNGVNAAGAGGAGGGGGGAYAIRNSWAVAPGEQINYSVGTSVLGGASGKTTFGIGLNICVADYGQPGGNSGTFVDGSGGAGGQAANSTGDTTISGGTGGVGGSPWGGAGGAGANGGGAGGYAGQFGSTPTTGGTPGGGGGGGSEYSGSYYPDYYGAVGAPGEVIVSYVLAGPTITGISPASAAPNAPVTISGANFGSTQSSSTVTFNGVPAAPSSWGPTSIVVPVPSSALTGVVVVTVNGVPSNSWPFTVAPVISSLSPASGQFGTVVTITGTNFGSSQGSSSVVFNGTPGTPSSWSATNIVVPVPPRATTGNVIVTVGGLTSNAFGFAVTPIPYFTVSAPSSATAGTPVSITVTAFDQNNNLLTSYTGAVHFTSSDPQAVLPANTTLSNGSATFSATLKTAGSQLITATDAVTTSMTGNSGRIAVATASPTKLAFSTQPPLTGAENVALSPAPVVLVQDVYGNTIAGSTASIAMTSSPAGVTGTTTVSATGGAATFGNLAFSTPGTYTLIASSSGLASATSSPISIGTGSIPQNLTITTPLVPSTSCQAQNTITLSGSASVSGGNVLCVAGSQIILGPNFTAVGGSGTTFTAVIK